MRFLALLAVALLLLPAATAQTMTVTSAHQVRIGYGDLPITDSQTEPAGFWNVEQLLVLPEGSNGTVLIPRGHLLGTIQCGNGCDFDATLENSPEGDRITAVCITPSDDGFCSVSIPHRIAGSVDAFAVRLPVASDTTLFVYALEGLDVRSGTADLLPQPFYYPGLEPATLIHQFTPVNGVAWVTVSPHSTVATPSVDATTVVWAGIAGLVVGIVLWYVLVARGMVQKRQRKQIAGEAAHSQVAKKENRATLEARKRALMAALKDLEVARMDQSIDLAAYDILKADFKRQAVTVMRAIEELGES